MIYAGVLLDTAEQSPVCCGCSVKIVMGLGTQHSQRKYIQYSLSKWTFYFSVLDFSAQIIFPSNPFDHLIVFQKHGWCMFFCQTWMIPFIMQHHLLVYLYPHNSFVFLIFLVFSFQINHLSCSSQSINLVRWFMRRCSMLLCSPGTGPQGCFKNRSFPERDYTENFCFHLLWPVQTWWF